MATIKEYAYYLRGNKIAIVERDFTSIQNGQTIGVPDIDLPIGGGTWASPTSTVTNGLEIEYSYVPDYWINDTSDVDTNIDAYRSWEGNLEMIDNTAVSQNYTTAPQSLSVGDFIVLKSAGQFNGLHKISAISSIIGTNNVLRFTTKYSGSNTTWTDFENTPSLYYNIDTLNNEADEIPIEPALQRALVYYVKARLAEDQRDFKTQEYFMKQFRKLIERHETARIHGSRKIMPGSTAIR